MDKKQQANQRRTATETMNWEVVRFKVFAVLSAPPLLLAINRWERETQLLSTEGNTSRAYQLHPQQNPCQDLASTIASM